MLEFFRKLFDTSEFRPATFGEGRYENLVLFHILSDTAAAVAYVAVGILFSYYLLRANAGSIPKRVWLPVVLLFAAALMELMEIWQFYWPAYRFAGLLKFITALLSWGTLLSFVPILSRAVSGFAWNDLQVQITRRQKAEEKLREAEAAHQSLLESLPLNYFRKDAEGRFVEANQRFCATLDMAIDRLIGKTDYEIFPREEAEAYQAGDQRILESGDVLEAVEEQTLPDGRVTYIQVLKAPVRDYAGTKVGVHGIFWDVTERKQVDDARRLADARFRTLVDSSLIGIMVGDLKGTIYDANDAFLNLLGYSRDDIAAGRISWTSITPPLFHALDAKAILLLEEDGTCLPYEKEFLHRRGHHVPVVFGLTMLPEEQDRCICFVLDITERKRFERELREARDAADAASYAKSRFLANMSHEVRTPMNAIVGLTELVLRSSIGQKQSEYLKLVLESAESLLSVINDILDFSKIEAGKMELVDEPFWLRDAVVDAIRPFSLRAHEKGVELAYDVDSSVPDAVVGDPGRLRQVIVNLVGNAIKFTERGSVIVRATLDDTADDIVTIHFQVSDTGIGIAPEKVASIFEAFEQADASTTRQYGGTGLGLAIAQRFIELMRGRIWVESTPGRGSDFHFMVRLAMARDRAMPPARRVIEIERGLRVLVVDDFEVNRRIVLEMLRNWGLRGEAVNNASDALASLRRAAESSDPFRLLLTDANMPGEDGFELAAKVEAEFAERRPKTIMLTSGERSDDAQRLRETTIDAHLLKPVKQSDLFDSIAAVLGAIAAPEENVEDELPRLPPLDVLLVEDSLVNQKLALGVLGQYGHRVTVANNGKEAVDLSAAKSFNVVLMDVQMPIMDGLEATQTIREREATTGGHVPIIAMTAHALVGDRERCLAVGMDYYLSKPIRPRQLIETIAAATGKAMLVEPAQAEIPVVETTPADAEPLIDWTKALAATGGDRELLCELIDAYFLECPRLERELNDSLDQGDFELMHRSAHTIKSSMRLFAASRPMKLALALETLGREKQREGALVLRDQLMVELEKLSPVLLNYRHQFRGQ